MPQFEIHDAKTNDTSVVRARNKRSAVVSFYSLKEDEEVVFVDAGKLDGWESVVVNGSNFGTVRHFHRMKFRRD